MVTREQILSVLSKVDDPEVHRNIVELEMVREIHIAGAHADIEIALTISGCPLRNRIEEEVRQALDSLPGLETYKLDFSAMTDEERQRFAQKVRGQNADSAKQGESAVPPLLRSEAATKFLAVASGKGGVGKSTVTANLAVSLARLGLRVGVIDADIYGFSIPTLFGLGDRKPALVEGLIMPVQEEGVKIISMGFFVPDNNPVIWRGPMLGKMLRNFFAEVHWGNLDVMLLDLPPGTGDVALDVHSMLPESQEIIVTTPQVGAAEVAARAGTMALKTNHELLGVVENMSYFMCDQCEKKHYIFGAGGGKRLARELKTNLLAEIPLGIATASGRGIYPAESLQGQVFAQLSGQVAEMLSLPRNRQ